MKLIPHPFRTRLRDRRFVIFSLLILLSLLSTSGLALQNVNASGAPMRERAATSATRLLARIGPGRAMLASFFAMQTVTSGGDSGAGTLRDAISAAAAGDTIVFSGVTTVTLTSGELVINKNLTIDGGTGVTVTRGSGTFRIFNVSGGVTVSMNKLSITNGLMSSGQAGGVQNSGTLTLTDCTISGNRAPQSGGIQNDNSLTMTRCTVSGNSTSSGFGAGVLVYGSTTNITNCTFANNSSALDTGAFGVDAAVTATLTNCTIVGNSAATGYGGGVSEIHGSANIVLKNCIVLNNTAPTNANIQGTVTSSSTNNLIGVSGTGGLTSGPPSNNLVGVTVANALLGTLGDYGGPTQTIPLLPGSPALSAATSTGAPTTDQRGITRTGLFDIGAFESQGFTLNISGGNNQSTAINTAFTNPLAVTITANDVLEPFNGGQVTFNPPGSGVSCTVTNSPATISGGSASSGTVTANGTAGAYTVSGFANGAIPVTFNLTNTCAAPTITLGANPTVVQSKTSANLPYTASTGSPNQYSIDYDSTANTAGFTDVTNASLPSSPIVLTVPGGAAAATYNGVLTVRNSSASCDSGTYPFTVTVVACPITFTVNDTGDAVDAAPGNGVCATAGGVCTLRGAIEEANAITPCTPLTINFNVTGTITLTSLLPTLAHPNLSINGPGANILTVSGATTYRVFNITSGDVTLDGFTIANGKVTGTNAQGGGIFNTSSGTVTIRNCAIANNTALATNGGASGGGIYHKGGTLNVSNSTLSGNTASSTGTSATSTGGGMFINDQSTGSVNVTNCTVVNNSCLANGTSSNLASGGGFYNSHLLNLTNCTISGNSVSGANSSTRGGGLTANAGTVTIGNTIVANNTSSNATSFGGPDLASNFTSTGYNLIKNTTSAFISGTTTGNQTGVDPLLAPLGNYGGPTQTFALLPGSPAIDGGTSSGAPSTDQRGISRVGNTDIGAFESRGFTLAYASGSPQSTNITTAFSNPLSVTVSSSNSEPINGGQIIFTPPGSGASATLATNPATISSGAAAVTATANGTGGGPYNVTASASGATGSATFALTNLAPDLAVSKSHSGSFTQGQTATWTIQVANNGTAATSGTTTVSDTLPAGYTLASYIGTGWSCTGTTTVTCTSSQTVSGTGGTFNALTLTVNVPTTSPSSVSNIAKVYSGGDPVHTSLGTAAFGSDTLTVQQVPASITANNGTTPQSTVVNTAFANALAVTVRDAANIVIPSASVSYSVPGSGPSASLSLQNTTTDASGITSVTATANTIVGGPYNVSATVGSVSTNFSLTNLPGAATHFAVTAPANATAGTAFSYTVTALDQFNNTATGYTGTVHFTSTDGAATLPANSTLTNGVGTFSATLKTVGNQMLTATDTVSAGITSTSGNITVSPGTATTLLVSAPANAAAGTAFNFTVTAKDACNNTATGYVGTVHFTSTDGAATLPSNYTFVAGDNGVHTFSATLKTAGVRTITATDTMSSSINGTSGNINVSAAAATHFTVSAPANAALGVGFNFTVTALDQFNNTATGYTGTVHFTSTDGAATLPANSTLTSGTSTFSATLNTIGNQTITATDTVTGAITGTSGNILVSLSGCPSTFTVNDTGDTTDANLGNGVCADSNGKCTLRAAIQEANALTACTPLTINFGVTGTITLGSALPTIVHPSLTITGPGADQLTVDGASLYRPFDIGIGNYAVTLSGLKVANGRGNGGGGLQNLSTGTVNVTSMTFANNAITASSGGGGIRHSGNGTMNVTGSTFVNNSSTGTGGGGINNISSSGTVNVTNCTFSGNLANIGGGIHTHSTGTTNVTNCTLVSNSGGIRNNSGTVTVKNTIAVGNTLDIDGTVTASNNLTGSLAGALLSALGNYGGTTQTFALLPGSPALNAGTSSGAPSIDQRGIARPLQSIVDIGAFESQGFTLTIAGGNNQSTSVNTAFANSLSVTVMAKGSGEPINGGKVTFTPPGSGASVTLASNPATITSGAATSAVTANSLTGGYNVSANAIGADAAINFSLTNSCPMIVVTTPSTTTGTAGTAFSQTFTQNGGIGTTTFSTMSTLSTGLSLSTGGVLSGTPTQTGTFPIMVKATDSNGCFSTSSAYNLVISCQIITVNKPVTATGTAGAAFSQTFTQSGGIATTTFSTTSTLPIGLTLATNGTLSGTPTQTGTFPITVKATDSNGCYGTSTSYNLVISCGTITVTPPAVSNAPINVLFNQPFTQTGAVGTATFTLETGSLPTGLILATTGVLSGIPTQMGAFPITVKVTDSNYCTGTSLTYTLRTNTAPTINPIAATRTIGSPATTSQIATVSDAEDAASQLTVTVNGASSATSGGITINSLTVDTAGKVQASIRAACGAVTTDFTLRVTDPQSAFSEATLRVTVTPNTPPILTYPTTVSGGLGQTLTVNPASGPTDNGTINSIVVQSTSAGFAGTANVASNGVVTINNVGPLGTHTITIKATDDCGLATTTSFTLGVIPFLVQISDPILCTGDNNLLSVHAEVTNPNVANAALNFNAAFPAQLTGVAGTCQSSAGTCTINNGGVTVTGNLGPNQTVLIDYKVKVANGTPPGTQLCINSTASLNGGNPALVQACTTLNCPPIPANVQAGAQKAGSVLVFPYYISKTAPRKDTRLTLSNIGMQTTYAHLFFIDGTSCDAADQFICLTPNASFSFKASEYDPETTGWLLAVAVNSDGVPIQNNSLVGNAFVTDGDYADNYGAEAFWAHSQALAIVQNNTATLFFDGGGYDAAPSQFVAEIQSPVDATNQRIVTVSLQGDLTTGQLSGANQVGSGQIFNGNEKPSASFSNFLFGKCQAIGIISTTVPRVPNGMNTMIPSGQVGSLKFNIGAGVGLLMSPHTAAWRGIRALHKTAQTTATFTIPVIRPVC